MLIFKKQSRNGNARKEFTAAPFADENSFPVRALERRDGTGIKRRDGTGIKRRDGTGIKRRDGTGIGGTR